MVASGGCGSSHHFLMGFGLQNRMHLCWLTNWPLYREGRERPKKEAGHSRLVSGSFNEQRELPYEACLGWQQDEWIHAPAHQILKGFQKALTGFRHVYHVGVLNTASLPQGHVLGEAPGRRKGKWDPHFKDRGGDKDLASAGVQLTGQLVVIFFYDLPPHGVSKSG